MTLLRPLSWLVVWVVVLAAAGDAPCAGKPEQTAPAKRAEAARELLAAGTRALEAGKTAQAIHFLERAVKLAPDNEQAHLLLALARRRTAVVGGKAVLGRFAQARSVAKQTAEFDFQKALRDAQQAVAAPDRITDFEAAAGSLEIARNILETSKGYFTAGEYRRLRLELEDLSEWLAAKRRRWILHVAKGQEAQMRQAESRRIDAAHKARQEHLSRQIAKARTHIEERRYAPAARIIEDILRIDPRNTWAGEQLGLVRQLKYLKEQKTVARAIKTGTSKVLLDIQRSEIPWHEEVNYPTDWRQISMRRKPFTAELYREESQADRLVQEALGKSIESMTFDDAPLVDVLDYLRIVSGVNIHVRWPRLADAQITPQTRVSIHLKGVTVAKALQLVLEDLSRAGGPVTTDIDSGVLTITTKDDLRSLVFTRVYDVRDMLIELPDFNAPRIPFATLGTGEDGEGEDAGIFEDVGGGADVAGAAATTEVRKSKEAILANIIQTITDSVEPDSWRSAGGDIGEMKALHGQLVVTQMPAAHKVIWKLLGEIREAQNMQIHVDARMLTISRGFLERIGIDMDFTFHGPGDGSTFGNLVFAGNQITQDHATWATSVTGLVGGILTPAVPEALSVAGTFLDDIQVDFLIQATQASESGTLLEGVRLMLQNGQRSYILMGTQQAYVSSFDPVVGQNAVGLRPEVSWLPTGRILEVTAWISADRRYVMMTIRFENIPNVLLETYAFGGGWVMLPTVTRRSVESTVSCPDGGTVALAGYKESGQFRREAGVPILSKIPIISRAFVNRAMVRDELEVLWLITPKIHIPAESEELAFPGGEARLGHTAAGGRTLIGSR